MKICKHNLCKNELVINNNRTFYCSDKCRFDRNKSIPLSFISCEVIDEKKHCLLLKYRTMYWVLAYCVDCSHSLFKRISKNDYFKRTHFFCNKKCVNNNKKNKGIITKTISMKWKEKTQNEIDKIQRRMRKTTKEIHGCETYRNVKQAKETWSNKPEKEIEQIRGQQRETTKILYGGLGFASKHIKEKATETYKNKTGYTHQMKNPNTRQQAKETYIKNNGGLGFASKSVYKKFVKKIKEIYGVSHPMKSKICQKNARNTMKENGTYGAKQSKIENIFYELLCTFYNTNDIKRHKDINNHDIDFYISSIDTYIQFDGVYWHGLDKPIEEIKEIANGGSKQAVGIYEGYFNDREQDKWFKDNNLKLIRITDIELKSAIKQNNFSQIINKIDT